MNGGGENAEGEPVTLGEVFDAATPRLIPGARKEDLLAALKNATVTGGHVTGRSAPDISMPVVTDLSGNGVRPEVMKALATGGGGLGYVAAALAHGEQKREVEPPAAAVSLAEMYNDLLAAGIPLGSVERILGAMLAAHAIMDTDG